MKWCNLLSANRINSIGNVKSTDIPDYYMDFNYISLSRMVRAMQDKSFIYPVKTNTMVRTQYSCEVETTAFARLVTSKAFNLIGKDNRSDIPDEVTRAHICELLSCAGMLQGVGSPPFGRIGETAIREWFRTNLKKIKYNEKSVHELLNDQMLDDFYEFSGSRRSLRRIVGYNDTDMQLTFSVLGVLANVRSRNSDNCFLYSERDLVRVIGEETHILQLKHPLSYILEASAYVVEITSAIEDASEADNLICRRILSVLRSEENFDEKTENGEYQKFAAVVKYLSSCYIELRSNPFVQSESGIVHRWIACVRNEMSDFIAQSFCTNYDLIMEGKYNDSLVSDSWCRIFKNAFDSIEKKMLISSEKFIGIEFKVSKIIDCLLDSFTKAVINYDTDDYDNSTYKNLLHVLPERYIQLYKKESAGKTETEKLYLRIVMVIDYICDMTDTQAESMYKHVNGII